MDLDEACTLFLDVEKANELLPHVDALRKLGLSTEHAMVLAASDVSVRECQQLLDRGCAPKLVVKLLT